MAKERASNKQPLTKKRFEAVLTRVFTTPVPELAGKRERGQVKKQTSAAHPSGDRSGRHKNPDTLEGKEDSHGG